jgi:nucleoside 2-deoxyribosyltransferase
VKKAFVIHPIRNVNDEFREKMEEQIEYLRNEYDIYDPEKDTNQIDSTGLRICEDNRNAMRKADIVIIVWDGKSEGCLFDLGMAFAMGKEIIILNGYFPTLKYAPKGKNFIRMVWAWEQEQEYWKENDYKFPL